MRKMRKVPLTPENKGLRRSHRAKTRKMRKMRTQKRGKCGKCGWLALMWLALGDPRQVDGISLKGSKISDKGLAQTEPFLVRQGPLCESRVGAGPNMVSESTASNTELSEAFCPHWVPGREVSEFLSAFCLCAKVNSPSFWQNSLSLPKSSYPLG